MRRRDSKADRDSVLIAWPDRAAASKRSAGAKSLETRADAQSRVFSNTEHGRHRCSLRTHGGGFAVIGTLIEVSLIGLVVWVAVTVIPLLSHSEQSNSPAETASTGDRIFRLSLTSDGQELAVHRSTAEIVAVDLASRRTRRICRPHQLRVARSFVSDDSAISLQSFEDKEFIIRRDGGIVMVERLTNLSHPMVALSSNGQAAVLVFGGSTARCWDLSSDNLEMWEFPLSEPPQRIAINDQATKLVSHTQAGNVHVYDLKTGDLTNSFAGSEPPTGDPTISVDGQWIVTIHGSTLDCFRVASSEMEWTVQIPEPDRFSRVAISPDGRRIAACSLLAGIHVIDHVSRELRHRVLPGSVMHQVAFSSSSDILYSGSTDGSIRVWSMLTAQEIDRIDLSQ